MNRNTHSRHKRIAYSLISIAFDGLKYTWLIKRDQQLQKGMQMLLEKQKRLDFQIESVEDDMMSIAKASLHEINHENNYQKYNSKIDFMARRIIHMEEAFINTRQEEKLNTLCLEYLTNYSRYNDTSH